MSFSHIFWVILIGWFSVALRVYTFLFDCLALLLVVYIDLLFMWLDGGLKCMVVQVVGCLFRLLIYCCGSLVVFAVNWLHSLIDYFRLLTGCLFCSLFV